MILLEVKNVTKKFGDNVVLKNISFTLNEKEALGILGRSGAGKSVLLHMLRGMDGYEPTEGEVIYHISYCKKCGFIDVPSKEICKKCNSEMEKLEVNLYEDKKYSYQLRKRIAIMFQRTFALYGDRTVLENVLEALHQAGYEGEEAYKRALELIKMVKLEHRITHIARDLSGGEKQRVVLARQVAKEPFIFLADEPTGTLDPKTAEIVHNALRNLVIDKGISLVLTSHWPEVIAELTDRAIWLEKGEILAEGNSKEIVKKFMEQVKEFKKPDVEVEIKEDIIRLENISKHYCSVDRGVIKAVDNVNLNIRENEIFGLVGPSGAGKTTLAKIIAGVLEPSKGRYLFRLGDEWIDMTKKGLHRGRVKRYIGILFQEYALYPYRTVLENLTVAIGLELPDEFARMKAIYTLTSVGFSEEEAEKILDKYPHELSVGERHRVALAQVLIKEPRVVILDEPTGTMDPITRNTVAESILKSRVELEQTYIIVSHDMDFVLKVCDRAGLMRKGKLVKVGKPEEIVKILTEEEKEEMFANK
ncbi:methyl coenzyme M reductase system, component A2 [Methanocaldococcus indicus]|uniref:methyl coenzyme M reductase system, component A2 n=1 Tax=Methanocaldococcus indicus TaxID=213231 RepID=UPI003C6D2A2A